MSRKDNGGTAFPVHHLPGNIRTVAEADAALLGMSLRDYFAAQAMPAEMARWQPEGHPSGFDGIAAGAYMMADAMMKVRLI